MSFKINKNAIKKVKEALAEGLIDSALELEKKVKDNAPVDSGKLRKSIDVEITDKFEVRVGTDVKYADDVEFGTINQAANPFFRTAVRENKKNMLKKFKGKI